MTTNGQEAKGQVSEGQDSDPQAMEVWRSAAPAREVDFEVYERLWKKLERYKKEVIKESDWQIIPTRSGPTRHLKQHRIQGLFALAGLSMVARPQIVEKKNPLPEGEAGKWAEPHENEVRVELYAVNPYGQVFHGIGTFQGRECRRKDGSVQWEDQNLNRLERMAYKRALAHLVKNALGGVDWIGEDESDEEAAPQAAPTQPAQALASKEQVERISQLARGRGPALELALRLYKAKAVVDLTAEQADAILAAWQ